jgi:3-oxoacyl-[acyl-carrier protein] reductase
VSLRLANNIGIITGAGSGIGGAMALACAREGAASVVFDLNPEAADATAREFGRIDPWKACRR